MGWLQPLAAGLEAALTNPSQSQNPVCEGRHADTHLCNAFGVQAGLNHYRALRLHGQYISPRVHYHAAPPGVAAVLMHSALGGGEDISLVFNGAGAQQQLPMGLARGVGESTGHQQQLRACSGVVPVQLRKAQVITHAQAHTPCLSVACLQLELHWHAAPFDHTCLVIVLTAMLKTKQVNLVIAGYALA